jgi:GYF domain 2
MSANWIVSVGGRTYGPYSADQMETFVAEGRLAAHSLVARDQEGQFGPASQDPMLAPFFLPREPAPEPQNEDVPRSFGQGDVAGDETTHYLIVADMKSGSITALEEEIYRLGPAYTVMPQAWILSSEMSIGPLRNLLIQKLGKLDLLLVVDATHDKLSWFNLGMEADTRVRRIWTKLPQLSAA